MEVTMSLSSENTKARVFLVDNEKNKARVFIVEDHPMFQERLAELINKEPDLRVCGAADNTIDALRLIKSTNAQIAVVDITLKGASGLELIKDLTARNETVPVLVLSMHDEALYAERALRAGAKGYVSKQEPSWKVMEAIKQVLQGEAYLSRKSVTKILKTIATGPRELSGIARLTDRELEVFELIGHGRTTREISVRLHLGLSTVDTYRARIKEKLNLENASQLAHEAIRWVEAGGRASAPQAAR
jgi:DNA-binding NarL/FixJ family response regulator